ncbi:substrate-binding domain-containing protein [Bradyrhizobium elkanii]|nr:substrate-binding domain-containing protein [Bradyrhizobium elkanii]
MKPILRQTLPLTALIAATAISIAPSARAEVPATCVKGVDLATLGPKSIVGQGPHGEKAASPEVLALSDADAAKIKEKHFKVGISMQTVNLDWAQLQIQGITDTLKKYGVTVTGVASAEYQVDKQIADIENTIQQHPDGIISIPVDFTATAPTYKKIAKAGIKLVLMDSIPTGLKHPEEYASMISADSQGNGQIAAQILASCVAQGGTIGLVNFGVDYFSTNERTKGVREWMQKNRPDIKMKAGRLHRPAEGVADRGRLPHRQSGYQRPVRGLGPAGARYAELDARAGHRHSGHHRRPRPAIGDRDRQGWSLEGDRVAAPL